uniref:Uncharacterized protein n=1 Tax=Timema tahoe TaxID=61484 RepID=A0A7R9IIG5_9NEOP|nr:unnamed protein product [Timema tahoe]
MQEFSCCVLLTPVNPLNVLIPLNPLNVLIPLNLLNVLLIPINPLNVLLIPLNSPNILPTSLNPLNNIWLVVLQGKASGKRAALWLRARLQAYLFQLGCFLYSHAGKVLFVAILVLATFCVGLKSAQVHTRVDQLWVQASSALSSRRDLKYKRDNISLGDPIKAKPTGSFTAHAPTIRDTSRWLHLLL